MNGSNNNGVPLYSIIVDKIRYHFKGGHVLHKCLMITLRLHAVERPQSITHTTFRLMTICLSAGKYLNGNTNLQLKLPTPSIER